MKPETRKELKKLLRPFIRKAEKEGLSSFFMFIDDRQVSWHIQPKEKRCLYCGKVRR